MKLNLNNECLSGIAGSQQADLRKSGRRHEVMFFVDMGVDVGSTVPVTQYLKHDA